MKSSAAMIVTSTLLTIARPAIADLIPTPDFSAHPIPTTILPDPPSSAWAVADMAALLVALGLATYFSLVTRSRRQLFVLTIASLAYFGFVRGGCVCPIGATQNVALALCSPSYIVPLTVIVFFTLPLVFTLFFGRAFCAAVCPLGAVQELVAIRTVRVPPWLDQALGLLPYVYLGTACVLAATNTAFIVCQFDPFVAMFRLSGSAAMLIFGGSLLLVGVFVGRPYCRYLCPYGAILRVLSRCSKWSVRIPPTSCINCRLCEDVCPYDAIQTPTPPLSVVESRAANKRLMAMLGLTPLLVISGAITGRHLGEPLAAWTPEVRLAKQLHQYELGSLTESSTAIDAFRADGRSPVEAYAAAIARQDHFHVLGTWLGAWVALVLGCKLVQLSLRHRRTEYQPSRSGCVSCGRCFWYCPVEQVRLGLISDVAEMVPEADS